MRIILKRSVKERERYYRLELIANLFGEFLLIRSFGAMNRFKPTGVIQQSYSSKHEAEKSMHTLILEKMKKGYVHHRASHP